MIAIICIVFLMAVALRFIWESERAHFDLKFSKAMNSMLHDHLQSTILELRKYRRKRGAKGRFIRGDL